jgi:hypothetical protein
MFKSRFQIAGPALAMASELIARARVSKILIVFVLTCTNHVRRHFSSVTRRSTAKRRVSSKPKPARNSAQLCMGKGMSAFGRGFMTNYQLWLQTSSAARLT